MAEPEFDLFEPGIAFLLNEAEIDKFKRYLVLGVMIHAEINLAKASLTDAIENEVVAEYSVGNISFHV